MAGEHRLAEARRLVTGFDADGRSTFVSDGPSHAKLVTSAWTRIDVWQALTVPTPVMAENSLGANALIPPPTNGYTYNITVFPPDDEWDYDGGYAEALAQAGAAASVIEGSPPGMHQTDTVDIVTIVSGELWAIVETGEALLQAGDTLVQRGTKHAWRNRSSVPAVMAAIQIAVIR